MPMPPLKLLHTADVHLDAYSHSRSGYWAERRRLIEEAFARTVQVAIEERVDLFLIVGDFFDSNRPSEEAIGFAVEQLRKLSMPAVILPGNHDCFSADSVYRKVDFQRECGNVRVIAAREGQRATFEALDLALWGKADSGDDHNFHPLDGLPPRGDKRWYVALAHGDVLLPGRKPWSSTSIRPEEIAAAPVDYLALGHWEPFEDVSRGGVTAVYAGAPMPLVDGVQGAGYAVVVTLDATDGVSFQRRRVAPRLPPASAL